MRRVAGKLVNDSIRQAKTFQASAAPTIGLDKSPCRGRQSYMNTRKTLKNFYSINCTSVVMRGADARTNPTSGFAYSRIMSFVEAPCRDCSRSILAGNIVRTTHCTYSVFNFHCVKILNHCYKHYATIIVQVMSHSVIRSPNLWRSCATSLSQSPRLRRILKFGKFSRNEEKYLRIYDLWRDANFYHSLHLYTISPWYAEREQIKRLFHTFPRGSDIYDAITPEIWNIAASMDPARFHAHPRFFFGQISFPG